MSDDFNALVRRSRTYRRFSGKPLAKDELLQLVDVARFAPSGNNMQVLRFAVADDPTTVAQIAAHHGWAALLPDFNGPAKNELPGGYIAICAPAKLAGNAIRLIDCGIAAQTMCLAAAQRGLGTCMVKSFDKTVADLFGVRQKGYEPLLIIALGEPAADEQVVLEPADAVHGVVYWRSAGNVHHVPKLSLDELML